MAGEHQGSTSTSSSQNNSSSTSSVNVTSKLRANLSGSGVGKAEFESKRGKLEFEVKVSGLSANSVYPVTVDGVIVGQLRTNSRGKGELKFESRKNNRPAFPADFPAITNASTIRVGDMTSGAFAASTEQRKR